MLENVCNIVYMYMYYRNTDYLASSEIKDKFRILHVFLLTMSHLNDFFIEFYEYLLIIQLGRVLLRCMQISIKGIGDITFTEV